MTLLVALLASTFFLSNALKLEYTKKIQNTPDIIITDTKAMRETLIDENLVSDLLSINGVSLALPRVYGAYYFSKADTIFKVIGVDEFETYPDKSLNALLLKNTLDENSMLVSKSVAKILKENYYDSYFNFVNADGTLKKVIIDKTFESKNSFREEYLIVMPKCTAKEIFSYPSSMVTDIAVMVANGEEIGFIAKKIETLLPNAKVNIKEDLLVEYENRINFKSGFFLTIFIISFFTYFVIIYDKISGLSSEEKREVGILKAIGWRVSDILNAKLYEGLIISLSAYVIGIIIAFIYVYILGAPLLKSIFLNAISLLDDCELLFRVDYETLALLFFLSVPLYIAATIIPSWSVATHEADEVMR